MNQGEAVASLKSMGKSRFRDKKTKRLKDTVILDSFSRKSEQKKNLR